MSASGQSPRPSAIPVLHVRTEDGRAFQFQRPFHIGREHDCDVRIEDAHVSRKHVIVSFGNGHWRLRDQRSGNGVFIDDQRVETAQIDAGVTIRLGADGPRVLMEVESEAIASAVPPAPQRSGGETMIVASYAERYFSTPTDEEEPVGGRTLMIRKAFHRVQKKQQRMYRAIVAVVALAAIGAGAYAYRAHRTQVEQLKLVQDLFYDMKALDVSIASFEIRVAQSGSTQGQDEVKAYLEKRRRMESNYDHYLSGLNLYDHPLTPQQQLILRVTRMFGECEMAAPPEYLAEVASYIRKWQTTGRYASAVNRAREMGYTRKIAEEFQKQDLPPQFFYLAMQESDFNEVATGPPTRFGFAKGMWMFIPETGVRYGLKIGPLAAFRRPDVADDRHNWEKATRAAARYIKEIYSTDAQASGLLVMASYNWGEGRVINMLRSMPANPRERNFWKVLERHRDRVPKETYDYVLSIVSAAVIGENPKLFGFGFDGPLAFLDTR
jgi:membrane-bound lytic murein transglycosylase D